MSLWFWAFVWFMCWMGLTSALSEMICLRMGWRGDPEYSRTFFYVGFGLVMTTVWFAS